MMTTEQAITRQAEISNAISKAFELLAQTRNMQVPNDKWQAEVEQVLRSIGAK